MALARSEQLDSLPLMKLAAAFSAIALLAIVGTAPARANDSEAEWALGGLVLKSNAAISMDREDLFISADEVRVDYTYTNHAPEDREVLIAFPLPAQPDAEYYSDYYSYPDWDELDFTTTIDGEEVDYEIADRAIVGTRDVTDLVAAEGWPLYWFRDYEFLESLSDLSETEKERLAGLGLLKADHDQAASSVQPAWQVQRNVVRKQVFPANATVRVRHRYAPLVGGSVGRVLYPSNRESYPEGLQDYRDKWCTDESFLAGIDRKLRPSPQGKVTYYGETWLGYELKSGANWLGPIKEFRLVVDKGEPGNLVSFCMDGVRKISPTQFEVVKQNFEPERDLDILLVSFYDIED